MQNIPTLSRKIRVGILFGGKSAEHEISILSAKNVVAALDTQKFEPVLIGIDTKGRWQELKSTVALKQITALHSESAVKEQALVAGIMAETKPIDVIFPILHGPLGEDGTVQGLLELANIPYVGCGVLSSAIGMDKDVAKRLLRDAGVAVADFVTLTQADRSQLDDNSVAKLGFPLFVKPANMGSSVGVSKAINAEELQQAIDAAFRYDRKILLEKAVIGDEVECAVLGNGQPRASVPGRIIPQADFYTYEAKYHDEDGTILEIPANISRDMTQKVQAVALKAYKTLGCEGMARIDMFVTKDGDVIVNEINTIPGFTKFSMYPQLWEASGISYTELITALLELAVERFDQKQRLQTTQ